MSFLFVTFVLPTVPACTITLVPLSPISDADIPDLIPNFHPLLTAGRNWADLAQGPVSQARDDETSEEIDVVDVFGTLWHRLSNGSDKSDNIDEDAADIGCVSTPMEAVGEIIGCRFLGGVKVPDLVVASTDDVVVADDDAGN